MTTCGNCLLPYYSALCPSFVYCPRCYAKEYKKPMPKSNAWREWLDKLTAAGISYRAHFYLADKMREWNAQTVPVKEKIEHIVQYMMAHSNGFDYHVFLDESGDDLRQELTSFLT